MVKKIMKTVTSTHVGSWEEAKYAFEMQFGDDLGLVHHNGEPKISLLGEPWNMGEYSLTTLAGLTERNVMEAIASEKLALAIGCMDKRFASHFFKWVRIKSKGQLVLPILVGAGIAQVGNAPRQLALKQLVNWLCKNGDVAKIWASGHLHNCGGLGYLCFSGVESVCDGLACTPGSSKEERFVKKQINAGVQAIIPASHRGRTQKVLVSQKRDGWPLMYPFR